MSKLETGDLEGYSLELAGWSGGNMDPHTLGPKEIDRLLVPPVKAYVYTTD